MGGIRVGGAREGEISKIIGGPDEIALLGKERKVYCLKESFERERVKRPQIPWLNISNTQF